MFCFLSGVNLCECLYNILAEEKFGEIKTPPFVFDHRANYAMYKFNFTENILNTIIKLTFTKQK